MGVYRAVDHNLGNARGDGPWDFLQGGVVAQDLRRQSHRDRLPRCDRVVVADEPVDLRKRAGFVACQKPTTLRFSLSSSCD